MACKDCVAEALEVALTLLHQSIIKQSEFTVGRNSTGFFVVVLMSLCPSPRTVYYLSAYTYYCVRVQYFQRSLCAQLFLCSSFLKLMIFDFHLILAVKRHVQGKVWVGVVLIHQTILLWTMSNGL